MHKGPEVGESKLFLNNQMRFVSFSWGGESAGPVPKPPGCWDIII